jgi:dTDP-4-amino-4,6-dideoxygalactose transaminase
MKIEVYSPTIRRKEMDAVLTAMVEEKIGPGERNRLLIQTAKEQLRFDYALALRSPAVALFLALKALNIKQGQSIIISALSPRYYLQVINDLQLTPVFCDVTYDFPCISRELIENIIVEKKDDSAIGAIVLHHTLGFIPDTASIAELGIPVIEDISQSYGLKTGDKKDEMASGSRGCGVFCILGLEERDMLTAGGGALIFAMNKKDGTILRNFTGIADEYCLPDINAALAVVQFRELQKNIERRNEIAKIYINASLRTRHKRFISLSEEENNCFSFSLVLETGLKDVIAYARKKEILLENAFEKTAASSGLCENCNVSNSLALRTVLFPMYPRLRSADVERVSRLIMTLP